jgi:hypothetical protein
MGPSRPYPARKCLKASETTVASGPQARPGIRPGQPIELGVDTSRLHFFDPDSALSIGHPDG